MSNLELWEQVRSVPAEAQKTIGGGRLKGMTDINPMWRIKTLTDIYGVCGFGWYYDITKKELIPCVNDEVVAVVDINLYIKSGDKWSMPIAGTGGSMLTSKEKAGLYNNDEAFKMALTDAISVSCKALGIGADIYWSKDNTKYTKTEEPKETSKADAITEADKKEMERLDIRMEKLAEYFKKPIFCLTHDEVQSAINTKKKHIEKSGEANDKI